MVCRSSSPAPLVCMACKCRCRAKATVLRFGPQARGRRKPGGRGSAGGFDEPPGPLRRGGTAGAAFSAGGHQHSRKHRQPSCDGVWGLLSTGSPPWGQARALQPLAARRVERRLLIRCLRQREGGFSAVRQRIGRGALSEGESLHVYVFARFGPRAVMTGVPRGALMYVFGAPYMCRRLQPRGGTLLPGEGQPGVSAFSHRVHSTCSNASPLLRGLLAPVSGSPPPPLAPTLPPTGPCAPCVSVSAPL